VLLDRVRICLAADGIPTRIQKIMNHDATKVKYPGLPRPLGSHFQWAGMGGTAVVSIYQADRNNRSLELVKALRHGIHRAKSRRVE
jgi:hypothetical protein